MKIMIMIGSLAASIVKARFDDIDNGCCRYFTEADFGGQMLERCHDAFWQELPSEF